MKKKILFLLFISSTLFIKSAFADKKEQLIEQGKKIYSANCSMCHGETGKGDGPVGKNLTPKLPALNKYLEKQIVDILNAGKIPMMSTYKTSLTAEQKEAVAKYIKEKFSKSQ